MIRIKKKKSDIPGILKADGAALITALENMSTAQRLAHKFNSKVYGGKTVKDKLKSLQKDKCCFCEAKVAHVSHGDVEHYRPKAGWVQKEKDKLTKPGYYWLAYDFSNLFLSCQICNQSYKKNYFPLRDATKRANKHQDKVVDEDPLIVDPGGKQEPSRYLTFHKEMIVPKDNHPKGIETIKRTGLNRKEAVENRFEYLKVMALVAALARGTTTDAAAARAQLKVAGSAGSIYSLMVRVNFPDLV